MENKQTKRTKGLSKPGETSEAATDSIPTMEAPVMEAPKPQAPKSKKRPAIKQDIRESKACVYESIKNKGPAYMLMSRGIRIHDKETDKVRFANYSPSEPTIWKDEQLENSASAPVIFRNGYLTVPANDPALRFFMEIHPGNVVNGGKSFKIVDKKNDAAVEIKKEFAVHDAVSILKNAEMNDLLSVALYFKVNIDKKSSEIKFDLLKIAKKKPTEFINAFDDPMVKTKATIRQAFDYQMLKSNATSVRWFDSNSLIVSVPHGQEPEDILTRFCLTEKGASILSEIEQQLERLA